MMAPYLRSTPILDWQHPAVMARVAALGAGPDRMEIVRRCFEWTRDAILHAGDHEIDPVTCSASEVLEVGAGFCYAKAHLLVALLRANSIPAGLCYQRLSLRGDGPPFCLHGLVAAQLPGLGWFRLDPRGQREGLDARFTPPVERIPFSADREGEADLPEIWPDPLPVVVEALRSSPDHRALRDRLPDIPILVRKHDD